MKHLSYILIALLAFPMMSCLEEGSGLSEGEVVDGLKTALKVGADTSVTILNAEDGYYRDEAIKIFLPPEADIVVDNISQIPGGDALVDDVILRVNRSAENAATKAKPIFSDAITNLTIQDGWAILNGTNPAETAKHASAEFDSTAATNYLKSTTYTALQTSFGPDIDEALDKPLVGGVSAGKTWTSLTSKWNTFVNSGGFLLGFNTVNTSLGQHVTGKALDGVFNKVGNAERGIRRDPIGWAVSVAESILERVFGSGA